jgi:hypothetical protein
MSTLDLTPRLSDPDGIFEALVAAHRGLDAEASRRLDARLVLILANHIGDTGVVLAAIAEARRSSRGGLDHDDAARDGPADGDESSP